MSMNIWVRSQIGNVLFCPYKNHQMNSPLRGQQLDTIRALQVSYAAAHNGIKKWFVHNDQPGTLMKKILLLNFSEKSHKRR
ncbi:hypothetical protein Peur_059516 [Populus x canadensis]